MEDIKRFEDVEIIKRVEDVEDIKRHITSWFHTISKRGITLTFRPLETHWNKCV